MFCEHVVCSLVSKFLKAIQIMGRILESFEIVKVIQNLILLGLLRMFVFQSRQVLYCHRFPSVCTVLDVDEVASSSIVKSVDKLFVELSAKQYRCGRLFRNIHYVL